MAATAPTHAHHVSSQEILASRLLLLANDTDRVGLHREATALARFAASVLDGRNIDVPNA